MPKHFLALLIFLFAHATIADTYTGKVISVMDGDTIKIEIDKVGGFSFTVNDHLKRSWERGVDEETAKDMREGTGGPGRRKRPL